MGKFVAKRQLRNSYSQKEKIKEVTQINGLYSKNKVNGIRKDINNNSKKKNSNISREKATDKVLKYKEKYLIKLAIQTISVVAIFIFIVCVKLLDIKVVKNSNITNIVKREFDKNYTLQDIKKYIGASLDNVYAVISPIIPDELSQKTVAVFSNMLNNIKEYGNKEVKIYSEVNIYQEKTDSLEGITLEVMSTNVIEEDDVSKILNSGVQFVKPTNGIITSNYGEREEIFKGNGNFHYGVDIANTKGTAIVSSIDGTVTVCNENNGYGKYIEVVNEDITTRYCHLDKITIKEGNQVTAGNKIGEMGMTGQATGNHLHFEILYEGKRVNPQAVLALE